MVDDVSTWLSIAWKQMKIRGILNFISNFISNFQICSHGGTIKHPGLHAINKQQSFGISVEEHENVNSFLESWFSTHNGYELNKR